MILNAGARARTVGAVAARIPDGASIAVSIGTTPEMVVRALRAHTGLRIVTNTIAAALTASANPGFEVAITGGRIRPEGYDVLGRQVEEFFSACKVDFGLFGVGEALEEIAAMIRDTGHELITDTNQADAFAILPELAEVAE